MKISIITASYNYEKYIAQAIESVMNQTHQNWELIIVDDGSSDNSVEIIKSYCKKDERIKLFQHQGDVNKGLKETLLLGLENSTGDWIAFLESDDIFKPDNLLRKIEVIEKNPSVKLVFNKVDFIWDEERRRDNEKKFEKIQKNLSKKQFPRDFFYDLYFRNKILTFSAVAVEKKSLESLDFNCPFEDSLDRWLWVQLAYKNDFYYIDEPLTIWRQHLQSYNAQTKAKNIRFNSKEIYMKMFKKTRDIKILFYILFFYKAFSIDR